MYQGELNDLKYLLLDIDNIQRAYFWFEIHKESYFSWDLWKWDTSDITWGLQAVLILHFAWACEWLCMGSPTCFSKRKLLCKCWHFLPMLLNFYIFDKYLYVYEFFITNEEINSNIKSLKLITSSGWISYYAKLA